MKFTEALEHIAEHGGMAKYDVGGDTFGQISFDKSGNLISFPYKNITTNCLSHKWQIVEEPKPEPKLVKYYSWYWRTRSEESGKKYTDWVFSGVRIEKYDANAGISENLKGIEYYRDPTPILLPE